MTQRLMQALVKLDPRLVLGLMVLIVALVAFEGWFLILRQPYAEYRQKLSARATLASSLSQSADQSGELARLATELKQLKDKLADELRLAASDDKMAASLMGALDHSAASYGVMLSGVKPGQKRPVPLFEEVSFEVSAKGGYLQLCEWMLDLGRTLGNSATVTEFDMKSVEDGRQVVLSMVVALYRPLKPNELAK